MKVLVLDVKDPLEIFNTKTKMSKTKRTLKVKIIRFFQNDTVQLIIPWVALVVTLYFFILASS